MSKAKQKGYRNEKAIAAYFGGERRGTLGREDINHPIVSIEKKHYGEGLMPKFIQKVYGQAERNAPAGKIPIAVLHACNQPHGEDFVIIKARDLKPFIETYQGVTCR